MRIAIASFSGMPPEFRDDEILMEQLRLRGAEVLRRPWDDAAVDWPSFDLVVGRSVWDYVLRHDEFMAWLEIVGPRLENSRELMRWNSDKRYLGDLAEMGVPVVETTYVEPGMQPPPIDSEVVIKPSISAGGRDTGRFGPGSAAGGSALIERITSSGGTAMVQPFLASVDSAGETAVVMIDGELSHVLRKGAILAADVVAPVRTDDELGVAEVMYDPGLVLAGTADDDELQLAERMIAAIRERFGVTPLYARVDMLRESDGTPVLLELEAIEPNLYFDQAPGAAERLADAIVARASSA
jgi:glutathione synthase/RimK-type ligase-like ATP-grasp enzyme